jgi:hypothetical protein
VLDLTGSPNLSGLVPSPKTEQRKQAK